MHSNTLVFDRKSDKRASSSSFLEFGMLFHSVNKIYSGRSPIIIRIKKRKTETNFTYVTYNVHRTYMYFSNQIIIISICSNLLDCDESAFYCFEHRIFQSNDSFLRPISHLSFPFRNSILKWTSIANFNISFYWFRRHMFLLRLLIWLIHLIFRVMKLLRTLVDIQLH